MPRKGRYNVGRPSDLRAAPPWHRLAYIIKALPVGLEPLARDMRVPPDGRILDFGCADTPYRRFFPSSVDYVGADLPGNPLASVDIDADGTVPLESESFDAVISTQVLEHVEDPGVYLDECVRVLRPGRRMLLSTHGIMVYHPDPVDYWRWTGEGLRRAVSSAGFEVERFEGIMGLAATGLQLFQDAVWWGVPRPLRPLLALALQSAITVADRLQGAESRRHNALVFALMARKL
jgi:SAM-dependent methyltransferase